MRFFVEFSYKGTAYHGWQIQPNANTVQAELNKALSILLNIPVEVSGAGRTDAGVHAKQMFAHFDIEKNFDIEKLVFKLNSFLPDDIAVSDIVKVDDDTHCRFAATSRTYQYHISKQKDPFNSQAYFYYKKLDVNAMNTACKYLLGKQDFTSFSKVHTQTFTNNCEVMLARWDDNGSELVFTIKADRFLRNMVRAIVGTLLAVGEGKISADSIIGIIANKDRSSAGVSVPAQGLFLIEIEYPFLEGGS